MDFVKFSLTFDEKHMLDNTWSKVKQYLHMKHSEYGHLRLKVEGESTDDRHIFYYFSIKI